MSLDINIIYHAPKMENYGKTHKFVMGGAEYDDEEVGTWEANITHNCGRIAEHIPVKGKTLYDYVWSDKDGETNEMRGVLEEGITYMITHKEYLEQWNPLNGWGSYDGFLAWLMDYWMACIDNPGCVIKVSK